MLAARGAAGSEDQDDRVFMPLPAMRSKLVREGPPRMVERIYVQARTHADVGAMKEQVLAIVRQRLGTSDGGPGDARVSDTTEVAEAAQEAARTLGLLLAGIAAVSLIVGGVGIMNIMLVSVTERTREIGIRLAVGAKARYILGQSLAEALVLSTLGGLAGLALGTGATKTLASQMSWPVLLEPDSYAVGFAFAASVGMVFGIYPARHASRLDPITALRSD